MNRIIIIGRLTQTPILKATQNNISVTRLCVAVNRSADREKTDFFNVIAWRGLAEVCAKNLVKGQQVAVTGELHTRSYETEDGQKRYTAEIAAADIEFLQKPQGQPTEAFSLLSEDKRTADLITDEELPY